MNYKKILLLLSLVLIPFLHLACSCGCGKNSAEEKYIKGYITVVGSEPNTKLALKTDDDKVYALQCSKELESDLRKNQGSYYYIVYSIITQELGLSVIVVEKVIPVIKENKTN
jgi:hypothetical protein